MLVMGIDGGGSNLRVGVYTTAIHPLFVVHHPNNVNPSVVGWDASKERLQIAIQELLNKSDIDAKDIAGVGVGIAGANAKKSIGWILQVIQPLLPDAVVVPSSDYEIALIGANGERYGVLLLAGTGTVGYGMNRRGESLLVGGWGYKIGDEGSGYWIGLESLKWVAKVIDGRAENSLLARLLLEAIGIQHNRDELVAWLYNVDTPKTREIAELARVVFSAADMGDQAAIDIVGRGVDHLSEMYDHICQTLSMESPPVVFAGGLLASQTHVAKQLCERLQLPEIPKPQYTPLEGAAMLALEYINKGK